MEVWGESMFDVNMKFEDISIISVNKNDLNSIKQSLSLENRKELENTFLEYYLSECDFFFKILKADNIIGFIKGSIEFKNPNEVWIRKFILYEKEQYANFGSKIMGRMTQFFSEKYNFYNFFVLTSKENKCFSNLLKESGFAFLRYLENENKMLIYSKRIN